MFQIENKLSATWQDNKTNF